MKRFTKLTAILLIALTVISLASCAKQPASSRKDLPADIQAIVNRGVLRVGVKEDVPKFGLRNTSTNEIEGFEIELVKLIAKDLFGDPTKYELTPVTAKTRGPLLDNGEIDLVIATFTITEERKLTYNFSTPYYTDAVGLLVKKSSNYNSLSDMNGAVIGVAQSATSKAAVSTEATNKNVSVTFAEYATYPEIKAALDSGRVQAFCVDGSILGGYVDDTTKILPDRFSPQDYGVASKLSNKDLAEYVDNLISGWIKDGTIKKLVTDWKLTF